MFCFISPSRLKSVINPLDTSLKQPQIVAKIISILFALSIVLSISITIGFRVYYNEVPFAACSPFVNVDTSNILIKIIAGSM